MKTGLLLLISLGISVSLVSCGKTDKPTIPASQEGLTPASSSVPEVTVSGKAAEF